MDWKEFRVMLQFLREYFEFAVMFQSIDDAKVEANPNLTLTRTLTHRRRQG